MFFQLRMPETFLPFLLACIIIELTPGPNMTYLMALSSVHGRKAGFSMVAGVAIGLLVIGFAAALGAATLIAESPLLYHLLRWAGTVYMVWLAWDSWRDHPLPEPGLDLDARYFRRGFITNILNPKAAIFYVTIFPSFIDPSYPVLPQSIIMTLFYVGIATFIHILIAILGDRIRHSIGKRVTPKMMRRFFSLLLLGIAMWFAWSSYHINL